jgi:glycosyltransferase involved in cell wall biosynthesis
MMGTRGVPALYGGFETAVEEIGARLVQRGHEVTVYSRNPGQNLTEYRGMTVVNMPAVRHRMAETLSHTALSAVHAIIKDKPDVCLLLNAGNAPFVTPLQAAGVPVAIHLDGLESRREKWRGTGARYYRWAERSAVRRADAVIADSETIARYVQRTYGRRCTFIPYGAEVIDVPAARLPEVGVVRRDYHLIVARFEPENHVLDAVHAYRASDETRPLIVVGTAPYSGWYIDKVHAAADNDSRIRFLGGVYDQELLDQLYGNARTYIHGHSVGGTNPSLLRAMGAGAPVLAFDVEFNREVTAGNALFWQEADDLTEILDEVAGGADDLVHSTMDEDLARFAQACRARVREVYQWDAVASEYELLLTQVASGMPARVG